MMAYTFVRPIMPSFDMEKAYRVERKSVKVTQKVINLYHINVNGNYVGLYRISYLILKNFKECFD